MTSQLETGVAVAQSSSIVPNPGPPASQFAVAYGRSFVFVVRCQPAYFEVGAETSLTEDAEGAEPTVRLCIDLGQGLEDVFHQLKDRFASDGYEPRFGAAEDIHTVLSDLSIDDSVKSHPRSLHPLHMPTDLALMLENGRVVFDDLSSPGVAHGLKHLPHTANPTVQSLYPIICAATHFYYHLRRTPSQRILSPHVELDLIQLARPRLGGWRTSKVVTRDEDGAVSILADGATPYGQKITNNSEYGLYPALFYFDNSDFHISCYYLLDRAATGAPVPPPIPSNTSFDVGYNGHGDPHVFYVRPGQKVDVGYFKLLLTTKHVDLSHIAQESPFDVLTSRGGGSKGSDTLSRGRKARMLKSAIWDEVTMVLVQREVTYRETPVEEDDEEDDDLHDCGHDGCRCLKACSF